MESELEDIMSKFQFDKPTFLEKEEEKYRKRELKRLRKKMLLYIFIPVLFISWLFYNHDLSKYKHLNSVGAKADAVSTYIPGGSYKYFFVTPDGVRIDKKGK